MADRQATPAERLEQLTSLYERQAYVVWNVAWRTALSEDAAGGSAQRAFLAQVTAPDEKRAALDAARHAAESGSRPDPREIDDPVLAATASLAPVQRAVLAVSALADVESEHTAAALGIDAAMEADLRQRSYEQLATLLGTSPREAEDAYDEVSWTPPPDELWAALYPELHGAVTRNARAAQAAEAEPEPRRRRRRLAIPRIAIAVVGLLAVAGVAWAATGGGGGDSGSSGPISAPSYAGPAADPGDSSASETSETPPSNARTPLSAQELDRLRTKEIEDLKRYMRQKQDTRLPPRERRHAAQKVSDLVKLAQARQRAAERRELAIRRALAREREARMRERAQRREEAERAARQQQEEEQASTPSEESSPKPRDRDGREKPDRSDDDSRTGDEAEAECLYNADTGSYICPE
jgi:hypothetical protein